MFCSKFGWIVVKNSQALQLQWVINPMLMAVLFLNRCKVLYPYTAERVGLYIPDDQEISREAVYGH